MIALKHRRAFVEIQRSINQAQIQIFLARNDREYIASKAAARRAALEDAARFISFAKHQINSL